MDDTNGWNVEVDDLNTDQLIIERTIDQSNTNCYDRNPLTPAQARTFAAALLRAADEAEGVADSVAAVRDAVRDFDNARYAEEAVVPGGVLVDTLERWLGSPADEEDDA